MQEQLDRAYDLIKRGDKIAAMKILQPLIRENRDNDDAWWLLANASDDATVKRNALNNVLRIGSTDVRESKAHQMLDALDNMPTIVDQSDKFTLDSVQPARQHASEPASQSTNDDQPYYGRPVEGERRSGGGCATAAKFIGGIIAVFGLCMCVITVGTIAALGDAFGEIVELPPTANQLGTIDYGDVKQDSLVDGEIDAFVYQAEANETITIQAKTLGNAANPDEFTLSPIIIVYGTDNVAIPTFNLAASDSSSLTITFESAGEYVITARSLLGAGLGDYTLQLMER